MNSFKGKSLVGLKYKPLFPYFIDHQNAFRVLSAEFVTVSDGTGIVHMAPGFGEEDHAVCLENNIKVVCPVNDSGCFDESLTNIKYKLIKKDEELCLSGRQVFETNDDIIKYLKANNYWIKTQEYLHNYPHCWRTDTPIIYKTVSSWYVKVLSIKDRICELNKDINWIPSHIRDGMFGKWIANTRDWSISRNRFFGCPVPVWKSDNAKYPRIDVYGSIAELKKDFGDHYEKINGHKLEIIDMHRPFIDELVRPNPDDPTGQSIMRRVEDVLDCWFESGAMPFASIHYPFEYKINGKVERSIEENKKWFQENYPADCISEYMSQTRGWFYTLAVLGVAIFDKIPFKNCICHGVVLDKNGEKLSKRLKNYPDLKLMFNTYGSDAMRFTMVKSPVMRGREICIDIDGNFIRETSRLVILAFWNAAVFLKTYMEADNLLTIENNQENFFSFDSKNIMDRYIISELHNMVKNFTTAMDNFDTTSACEKVEGFLDSMNNWYIRRSRKRFSGSIRMSNPESVAKTNADLEMARSLKREILKEIAQKSIDFPYSESSRSYWSQQNINNRSGHEAYIQSVIADIIHSESQQPWRIKKTNSEITLIDNDKQSAFETLYSVLLTLCKTTAPLLPCITEKIYLDLIGFKI